MTFKLVRIVCFVPYILYHLLTLAKYKKNRGGSRYLHITVCTVCFLDCNGAFR